MGNRKAREFVRQQRDDADWQRLQTEVREAADEVHARGLGARRLQLIEIPSFELASAWEVRQLDDQWLLFSSCVDSGPWPTTRLRRYDPIACPSSLLADYFHRLVRSSVPLALGFTGQAGLDGTITQLALFGDLYAELRFQWWSEYPAGWRPLVEVTEEFLKALAKVEAEAEREGS